MSLIYFQTDSLATSGTNTLQFNVCLIIGIIKQCFLKKSNTTSKEDTNWYRGHKQQFELS
jgi:hypothetical protein